jgi:hypothetical protein
MYERAAYELVVVDASVALSWAFEDEANDYSQAVYEAAQRRPMLVPSI